MIKRCDKGAGIIILDFEEYMRACHDHLNSNLENPNGSKNPYYTKVEKSELEVAKSKVKVVLIEAKDNNLISDEEFLAMDPDDKGAAKFYLLFKVHKAHTPMKAPPERAIVSGCNSVMENVGKLVEHYIKEIATTHPTYLQDTPDFLRFLQNLNEKGDIPTNSILVTFDIVGLFTNIPKKEGLQAIREALIERQNCEMPTEFIVRLLKLLLENNIFEFDGNYYRQHIGAAMGSKPIPPYANIFLARKIDNQILEIANKYSKNGENPIKFLKRFLDDLFSIWTGTSKELHNFLDDINKIHPNIKFTMNHTSSNMENPEDKCNCSEIQSIPFLDTSCNLKKNQVITDLYRKPTDRNQYLLTNSCHPPECLSNIPFSLALRITRICSETETREMRYDELKQLLISRKYKNGLIDSAINKARKILRQQALKRVAKPTQIKRPIFVVTFDPRLPSLSQIQNRHWRSMTTQDSYLKSVYPEPPLLAYKRQRNISDMLIRAKLPPPVKPYPERKLVGVTKCGKQCPVCSYIKEGKLIKKQNQNWKITDKIDCNTNNIVYLIECNKPNCNQRYIGETNRSLRVRISEHIGYVNNKKTEQATGEHFNSRGHTLSNLTATVIEKVKKSDLLYRKEREKLHISQFNTFYKGLNKRPE